MPNYIRSWFLKYLNKDQHTEKMAWLSVNSSGAAYFLSIETNYNKNGLRISGNVVHVSVIDTTNLWVHPRAYQGEMEPRARYKSGATMFEVRI